MTKKCYMCDAPAVGKEHVPPRCLFPKPEDLPGGVDLRLNLMTVPSCDAHNSEKSEDDTYFLNVLTAQSGINEVGREHYRKQIRRQFSKDKTGLENLARSSFEHEKRLAFEIDIDRFDRYVLHLAHGIYHAHFKSRWTGEVGWIPEVFSRVDQQLEQERLAAIEAVDSQFQGATFFGQNPKVFRYQVRIEDDETIWMRLHFYEDSKFTFCYQMRT